MQCKQLIFPSPPLPPRRTYRVANAAVLSRTRTEPNAQMGTANQLEAAMAERDALLELKHAREERQQTEAAAALARTRSAEKRQQLEAAKAELARLKSMKASAASAPPRAKSPVEEELDAAMAERDALLE
eukprot:COSAG01_NODE_7644_length_3115_cov_22.964854_1_plen_129_part_10